MAHYLHKLFEFLSFLRCHKDGLRELFFKPLSDTANCLLFDHSIFYPPLCSIKCILCKNKLIFIVNNLQNYHNLILFSIQ